MIESTERAFKILCMDKYRVIIRKVISGTSTVETGLKQRDTLSPVLFNLVLEKAVSVLQDNEGRLSISQNKIRILGFVDDVHIIGDSLVNTANRSQSAERRSGENRS